MHILHRITKMLKENKLGGGIERKDILQISQKHHLTLSENTIDTTLRRLTEKNLLLKSGRSKYSLPDKIFREYILQVKGYKGDGKILSIVI